MDHSLLQVDSAGLLRPGFSLAFPSGKENFGRLDISLLCIGMSDKGIKASNLNDFNFGILSSPFRIFTMLMSQKLLVLVINLLSLARAAFRNLR